MLSTAAAAAAPPKLRVAADVFTPPHAMPAFVRMHHAFDSRASPQRAANGPSSGARSAACAHAGAVPRRHGKARLLAQRSATSNVQRRQLRRGTHSQRARRPARRFEARAAAALRRRPAEAAALRHRGRRAAAERRLPSCGNSGRSAARGAAALRRACFSRGGPQRGAATAQLPPLRENASGAGERGASAAEPRRAGSSRGATLLHGGAPKLRGDRDWRAEQRAARAEHPESCVAGNAQLRCGPRERARKRCFVDSDSASWRGMLQRRSAAPREPRTRVARRKSRLVSDAAVLRPARA